MNTQRKLEPCEREGGGYPCFDRFRYVHVIIGIFFWFSYGSISLRAAAYDGADLTPWDLQSGHAALTVHGNLCSRASAQCGRP